MSRAHGMTCLRREEEAGVGFLAGREYTDSRSRLVEETGLRWEDEKEQNKRGGGWWSPNKRFEQWDQAHEGNGLLGYLGGGPQARSPRTGQ